jgi:hypothetical protein
MTIPDERRGTSANPAAIGNTARKIAWPGDPIRRCTSPMAIAAKAPQANKIAISAADTWAAPEMARRRLAPLKLVRVANAVESIG